MIVLVNNYHMLPPVRFLSGLGLVSVLVGLLTPFSEVSYRFQPLFLLSAASYVCMLALWFFAGASRRVAYYWLAVAGVAWFSDSLVAGIAYGSRGFAWNLFIPSSLLLLAGLYVLEAAGSLAQLARLLGVVSIITVLGYNVSGLSGGIYGGSPLYSVILIYMVAAVYSIWRMEGSRVSQGPVEPVSLVLLVVGAVLLVTGWLLVFAATPENFVPIAAEIVKDYLVFLAFLAVILYGIERGRWVKSVGILLLAFALYNGLTSFAGWDTYSSLMISLTTAYMASLLVLGPSRYPAVLLVVILVLYLLVPHLGVYTVNDRVAVPASLYSETTAPMAKGWTVRLSPLEPDMEKDTYTARLSITLSRDGGNVEWETTIRWYGWLPPYSGRTTYKLVFPSHVVKMSVMLEPELVSSIEAMVLCETLRPYPNNCTALFSGNIIVDITIYHDYVVVALIPAVSFLLASLILSFPMKRLDQLYDLLKGRRVRGGG